MKLQKVPAGGGESPQQRKHAEVINSIVEFDLPDWQRDPTAAEIAAGVTPTNYQHDAINVVNVKRYGALGNNTGDDSTAINNAISVAAIDGGVVFFPPGRYRCTSTLNMAAQVSLLGCGIESSILEFVSTNGLTFNFYAGFGKVVIDHLGINGTTATTNTAIIQTGSLDDSQELYGITIQNCAVTNFNTGIHFRQTRVVTIRNNWIQHVNRGIRLIGKNLVYNVTGNELVYGNGSGTGDKIGIEVDLFNFTGGTGVVGPEGLQISRNQVFGFETGFDLVFGNYFNVIKNDISALIYGIEFTTAQNTLNILGNYIEVNGAAGVCGVIGHGLASAIETIVNIKNNNFIGVSTSTAIGCQVNDSGNSNQNNVHIEGNNFFDWDTNDIRVYAGGHVFVRNNRCGSTAPTNSIDFVQVGVTLGPCVIEGNICDGAIVFDESDIAARELILGVNVTGGTTINGATTMAVSEVVTTTNTITASESGKTFYLNAAGGFTSTLPAPAAGLKFRFVVKAAPTTAYIVTTNAGANILYGAILESGDTTGAGIQAQDTLNFVASTAVVGDYADFESDGTNWYVRAVTQANGGITVSVT